MMTRHEITLIPLVCATLLAADPALAQFSQHGPKLVGTGAVGGIAGQGQAVSLSADGKTAIVGGPREGNRTGAAWVWTNVGGVWTPQGSKLVGSGAEGSAEQGMAVALSADGNTAIVGAPADDGGAEGSWGVGAAWVWTRSGGVWSQQGPKLVGSGAEGYASQGASVALSADGNTAIVGAPGDRWGAGGDGAVWVWSRSAGVWSQQGEKLVGTAATLGSYGAKQGTSVSLSDDGNTAIVGGSNDNDLAGAVWLWIRTAGVWTQQGPKLVGQGAVGKSSQGASVCLSADGNTAIVGGWRDNDEAGAVWLWTRRDGVWTQQGSRLVAESPQPVGRQGWSVSLSGDGNTAIVGGFPFITGASLPGGAWVWTRHEGVWTRQGEMLSGSDVQGGASQGRSVALSADGNTAIVGGPFDGADAGAAWIWSRSEGVWAQNGAKLVGSGAVEVAAQGTSVALSADGNAAIVGGSHDDANVGAAWIWTRSATVWTQEGSKLVGPDVVGSALQGSTVALSGDGKTAIVGGPGDDNWTGAAWVWTNVGGIWSPQGSKLVGSGAVQGVQGSSVSLSADGNTAIVGGPAADDVGAAWVWTRSGGVWTQQGSKLVGSGSVGPSRQGTSVALSADGNTAIVGGYKDDNTAGAVWVWTRSGGVWTQQGPKLVGSGAVACPSLGGAAGGQGYSVSISADGNTALIGGWVDNCNIGAAWVWTRSGGVWSQQGPKLLASDAAGPVPDQGFSVSLSADGDTAIVGGDRDNSGVGAAWVWKRNGAVWSQEELKLVGSDSLGASQQGRSVALSADGKMAMVGGPSDNGGVGAAWVFLAAPLVARFEYEPSEPVAGLPISFTNTTTGATSYSWSFGDGATSSSKSPPPHPYANPGTYIVTLTAWDGMKASATTSKAVTVTAPVYAGVDLLLPVVIDSVGMGGSHYTTEVTVASRASTPVDVSMLYTGSVGGGTGYAQITLAGGESRVIPDMVGFLRTRNLPLADDGLPKAGTLVLTFRGVTSGSTVYAGGRTYTPDPAGGDGTFGLFYAASALTNDSVTIFGLQQSDAQRSNLAVINGGSSSIKLRTNLFGPNGESLGALPDQLLGPYGWYQFNTPLAGKASSGRAVVTRLTGSSPFTAYGVLNDGMTSDGSFIPPLLPGDSTGGTRLVPIVLDVQGLSGRFNSEMTLTNFTSTSLPLTLDYNASPLLNAGGSGRVPLTLNPNEQRVIRDVMGYLRASGLTIPPDGSGVGGSLLIQSPEGTAAGDFAAGVRTFSPTASGGSFGLFYPGLTLGESATSTVFLYGLQQNTAQRSNVAIVNRGDAGGAITIRITYYSGSGEVLRPTDERTLASGEWFQYSKPLEARGTSSGYARIERLSGSSRFAAYAILNDQVNGDGSYVPMTADAGDPPSDPPPTSNEVTYTLPGGVPLVMVRIPAGTFQMGAPATERGARSEEQPVHQVTLTSDYYMGKYEVTQAQWQAVMGTNPSYFSSCGGSCPVEQVSWDDIRGANGFIAKLNQLLGTTRFRLPTEAEWERAARGGRQTRFSFGDALDGDDCCGANAEANPYVWWYGSSESRTHAVGTKAANPYGLFDMHGNVSEWVSDYWYESYPTTAQTNPTGPWRSNSLYPYRVIRGGGADTGLERARSAFRTGRDPGTSNHPFHGFRLARSQ